MAAADSKVIYINRFQIGLFTQRSPLATPMSAMGLQVVNRLDTFRDGLNTDISTKMTLIRRAGFPRYCSNQLTGGEIPQGFYSFKNTSGTIKPMLDTNQRVAWFNTTAVTTVYSKGTTAQTSFVKVGDVLYTCDGTNAKRWDGSTVNDWGVAAPDTAAAVSLASGALTAFSGYKYVYCYFRSATGELSSASPYTADTLAFTSKHVELTGDCSDDSTVDKVQIYRNADGGSIYYFLAEVNNTGATWSYTDTTADNELNVDIIAPVANLNDPPPDGISLACFHMGRMWVATANLLYFGGGSQVTNGVPESCFPPANVFKLPGKITALASTSAGLAVWTTDDFYVVLGSDLASFVCKLYQANFGVATPNCVRQDGDLLFVFTTKGQLFSFASSLEEVGLNIRDRLAAFDPYKVSMALHRSGADEGLFISDGATDMYRYSVAQSCWSNKWQPVGGCGVTASIEVATADYRLMLGRAAAAGYLLARNITNYQDDGSSYTGYATIGALVLTPPGEVTTIASILLEALPIGTYPTISMLADEISGDFIPLPNPVPDPPKLAASTTLWSKRHYLAAAQTPLARQMRHLCVKVSFASEATANEVIGIGVHGE